MADDQIDIEIISEHTKELYPQARPRIISDNGPQFIAKDFKAKASSNSFGPRA